MIKLSLWSLAPGKKKKKNQPKTKQINKNKTKNKQPPPPPPQRKQQTDKQTSQVVPNLTPMSISGCDIPFSQSVRNLGFYLNETLSMDVHIKYLCRILFCQLRTVGKVRSFLSTNAANKLAISLILSRLDYCNSLLAGIPDNKLNKFQRIQNHVAL